LKKRWAASKKLLGNPKLKEDIIKFDIDGCEESMIKRVENYLAEKPDLNEKNVTNVSQAAASLLKWLVAVVKYYYANKKVKPKKAKLAVAQAEVAKL
jgi:dynein heavy chain